MGGMWVARVELAEPIRTLDLCGPSERPTDVAKNRERCQSLYTDLEGRENRLGILQELESAR